MLTTDLVVEAEASYTPELLVGWLNDCSRRRRWSCSRSSTGYSVLSRRPCVGATPAQVDPLQGAGNGGNSGLGLGGLMGVGCNFGGAGSGGAGWTANGQTATCGISTGGSFSTFVAADRRLDGLTGASWRRRCLPMRQLHHLAAAAAVTQAVVVETLTTTLLGELVREPVHSIVV